MSKEQTPKRLLQDMTVKTPLSLKTIISSNEPLRSLAQTPLSPMLGFKVAKTLKELDTVTENFYNERSAILNDLGTLNKESDKFEFEGDKEKEASDKIEALLEKDYEIDVAKISLGEFGDSKIEPRVFAILDWLIVE